MIIFIIIATIIVLLLLFLYLKKNNSKENYTTTACKWYQKTNTDGTCVDPKCPIPIKYYSCISEENSSIPTCKLTKPCTDLNKCYKDDNCNVKCDPRGIQGGTANTDQRQFLTMFVGKIKQNLNDKFFKIFYVKPDNTIGWKPSITYNSSDMLSALNRFITAEGFAGKKFYVGEENDSDEFRLNIGIINLCMFLAQAGNETIIFDACDENNWSEEKERGTNIYPFSAACGQGGQNYTDSSYYNSTDPDCCKVDDNMSIIANTNPSWYGAPPPLFCAPKTKTGEYIGRWDVIPEASPVCDQVPHDKFTNNEFFDAIKNGTTACKFYTSQKAGRISDQGQMYNISNEINGKPDNPRTDVQGCCWWGRGVIQTTGPCNIGKLNKALQDANYFKEENKSLCTNPELICDSNYPDLKWISGFYYWAITLQTYNKNGWNYIEELRKFTKNFMNSSNKPCFINSLKFKPNTFIYGVSGIVNRGCTNPGIDCSEFSLREDRRCCHFIFLMNMMNEYTQLTGTGLNGTIADCGYPDQNNFICQLCDKLGGLTENSTVLPCTTQPIIENFITMTWSGGSPNVGQNNLYPFQKCNADIIALASCLPDTMVGTDINTICDRILTANILDNINQYKSITNGSYLLSIGGSNATIDSWKILKQQEFNLTIKILDNLYTNYQIHGLDIDFEFGNDSTLNSDDAKNVLDFLIQISKTMKSKYKDYKIVFTIVGNFLKIVPGNQYVATKLKQNSQYIDYVCLMLYTNTMYPCSVSTISGGVGWGAYVKTGSTDPTCFIDQNTWNWGDPKDSEINKTVIDMFSNSIPIILAVVLFGGITSGKQAEYPCGYDCLKAVYDLCDDSSNNIRGIGIWCFGAKAAECQCLNPSPQYSDDNFNKLDVMNTIFDAFKKKDASKIPKDDVISSVLYNKNLLPWKGGLNGYGCGCSK